MGISLLVLLLALPAAVQAQFTYTTNNGRITITGYSGPSGVVVIPDNINGLPVTSIGNNAFEVCWRLTSVTIPNSVTNIGDSAFWDCTSLTSVTIGNSVTSIGNSAFAYCSSLTSVTIPNSVTNIGNSAFWDCTSLSSVTIGNSVTSIGNSAFGYCSSLTSVTIPNSLASIGNYAFEVCRSLTSVTIPNSVTSIGDSAFWDCTRLSSVTIGNSVTSIGKYAFAGCANLIGVYFNGNAPSLGSSAFSGDNNAIAYYLPGTTGWGATYGGSRTAVWVLPYPQILTTAPSFGIQTNRFGFLISWATNASVVVEASTTLALWSPVSTNALMDGWSYFSDSRWWTHYPARFYRIRSP